VAPPLVVADVEKKGKQQKNPVQVSSPIMAAVGKQGRQTKNSAKAVAPPFGAGVAKKASSRRSLVLLKQKLLVLEQSWKGYQIKWSLRQIRAKLRVPI